MKNYSHVFLKKRVFVQTLSINTGGILSCDTWYYFRIVAQNGTGTAYGSEKSFKTLSCATPTPTPPPTIVDLASFTAEAGDDGVVTLHWETASELNNAGFNIYRSRFKDGNDKKLNKALIPSEGKDVDGASYSYEDTPPAKGTYFYKLEDVDTNGVSTMHGPEKMRVRK